MTAKPRQRPSRSTPADPGSVVVPSTLWAAGTEPLDPGDRWPALIVSRAVREFCPPGGRALLIAWPAPASRGGLRAVAPDTAEACAHVEALGRTARHNPEPEGTDSGEVDLVLVSLLADHLDPVAAAEQVAALAVQRLAAGGLLVVLGRCRHTGAGVLIDPAGIVVAAAQATDLLFLQHIIAVPVTGTTIPTPTTAEARDSRHAVVHADVFAFLQPGPR